jgi:Zn ribbon nucleic-acid-binding protein
MFSHIERLGSEISVPIPKDENGYLGRECPENSCLGYFKVKPGTGLTENDLPCICPYCGHKDSPNKFWTEQQIQYAKSVAMKKIDDAVRADFKELEFEIKPQGNFGIGISMKLEPGTPLPIYHYREKQLETNIICSTCTLNYSVYGLFAFCPDCGDHNSLQILKSNLDLVRRQITLSETVTDKDFRRHLIEDALENCISSFDGFARECCHVRASSSSDPKQVHNLSFQNLPKASGRLKSLFGFDLQASVDPPDWHQCYIAFMQRHLLAHRSGVVDQQYLAETKDTANILGRRIAIDPAQVTALTFTIEKLGRHLLSLLPKIT